MHLFITEMDEDDNEEEDTDMVQKTANNKQKIQDLQKQVSYQTLLNTYWSSKKKSPSNLIRHQKLCRRICTLCDSPIVRSDVEMGPPTQQTELFEEAWKCICA